MGNTKKVRTLLIDADILMFRFAFRHQQEIQWSDAVTSEVLDVDRAEADIDSFIYSLLIATNCFDYLLCFTHSVNFRYKEMPEYKANRADTVPPKMLGRLKEYMMDKHPSKTQEWLEADDLIGILATSSPDSYVCATIDKDFLSLPVILYNWNKPLVRPFLNTERDADYWFHYQWLCGDTSDNYKGIRNVGDKKAKAILHGVSHKDFTKKVVETYAYKCYDWDYIVQQARMARILRYEDFDYTTKKPKLWSPDC